ncbi:MAG: hypothetical protein RBT45_08525 [Acholeplasmataceae bacterium]|jgi:hypothetical protein|nr:hypothetical protein [Acholeplasmataceae bacterium]
MLELHSVEIFANDRHKPTICMTYTLKEKQELDMFRMWVRVDVAENYEILNYANLLYYEIMINNKKPQEKHIFRAYQVLFGRKLWENYKTLTSLVNLESTLKFPPYYDFVEFTKDTMKLHTDKELARFTQKARQKYQKIKGDIIDT